MWNVIAPELALEMELRHSIPGATDEPMKDEGHLETCYLSQNQKTILWCKESCDFLNIFTQNQLNI